MVQSNGHLNTGDLSIAGIVDSLSQLFYHQRASNRFPLESRLSKSRRYYTKKVKLEKLWSSHKIPLSDFY